MCHFYLPRVVITHRNNWHCLSRGGKVSPSDFIFAVYMKADESEELAKFSLPDSEIIESVRNYGHFKENSVVLYK